MKKSLLLLLLTPISLLLYSQGSQNLKSIAISGKLDNFNGNSLFLEYFDEDFFVIIDTIQIKSDGTFIYETRKLKQAKQTRIRGGEVFMSNVFLAPGFSLKITGDAKSWNDFSLTKKINGIGSDVNQFQLKVDSIAVHANDTVDHFNLGQEHYFKYVDSQIKLQDSLAKIVFSRTNLNDQNVSYFNKLLNFDLNLMRLQIALNYLQRTGMQFNINTDVVKGSDSIFLQNRNIDQYLESPVFRNILKGYLFYKTSFDFKKDANLEKKENYQLEKTIVFFSSKVREYVIYNLINNGIYSIKTLKELSHFKDISNKYIQLIANIRYKQSIEKNINQKEHVLNLAQLGKDAPNFTLKNENGKIFKLEEFKGKLVYLDLWASWCKPCRIEVPFLQKIVTKYKNDKRIEFISISFDTNSDNWKKAIKTDKPTWIQLLDEDQVVQNAYDVYEIPRFIIVDKNGKLMDFEAPKPSNTEILEKILEVELSK